MRNIFAEAFDKALRTRGLSRQDLAYKVLPSFLLDIIQKYLRVEVDGLENLPQEGPFIVIANHSGFMGFDAVMLGHQLYQHLGRVPRIIAHKLWFLVPEISVHAHKLGLVPATFENGLTILKKNQPLILFPEGEEGNFKPTRYRYRLQRFRRGFVRLALSTGAPVVPAIVVGAEETHITLSQVRWAKEILGIIVPVPLNVIPLPAKWHIRFLPPIHIEKNLELLKDEEHLNKVSQDTRTYLQRALQDDLRNRKTIFV